MKKTGQILVVCLLIFSIMACADSRAEIEKGETTMEDHVTLNGAFEEPENEELEMEGMDSRTERKGKDVDYDRVAQLLNVSEEESWYGAYVDYLCYLKKRYPTQAGLSDINRAGEHIEVRTWESDDYIMRAIWDEAGGQQICTYEWIWKNEETEKTVTEQICRGEEMALKEKEQENIPDAVGYREAKLVKAGQAVSGNLYEVTENNFIQGIDEDFDGENLKDLQEAVKGLAFDDSMESSIPDDREAKYHILLIDAKGSYILDLMVSEDGSVWCGEGRFQPSDALDNWISVQVEKAEAR